jgi:hypothetical protein
MIVEERVSRLYVTNKVDIGEILDLSCTLQLEDVLAEFCNGLFVLGPVGKYSDLTTKLSVTPS